MGPYYIPRNIKDEGRILFIFTGKSMIYTSVGAGIGLIFYFLFQLLQMGIIGVIIVLILAGIGYAIGTFKIPDINRFEFTKKTGGENMDDVILRAIKFKRTKKKIYVYGKEVTKDEQ